METKGFLQFEIILLKKNQCGYRLQKSEYDVYFHPIELQVGENTRQILTSKNGPHTKRVKQPALV